MLFTRLWESDVVEWFEREANIPAPSAAEWYRAVGMLPDDLKHWKPITWVEDFPDWLYIALWKG